MKIECISVDDKFQKDFKCFRPQGLAEWNLFVLFKSYTYVFQNNDYVLAEPGTYCIFKKVHIQSIIREQLRLFMIFFILTMMKKMNKVIFKIYHSVHYPD